MKKLEFISFVAISWLLFLSLFVFPKQGLTREIWPDTVKVGGEFRTRVEARFNDDLNDVADDNDIFVLLRTRVYLDLNPTDQIKIFGMFQDSETLGQGNSFFKTPSQRSFYQGYLQVLTPGKLTTRIKAGRQELIYGDERLIGAFNWGNLGRSFDGLVIRVEDPHFWVDIFGTRIKLPNGKEAQLASTYGHWKDFPGGILEPYVIVYHGDEIGNNGMELSLVTLGARIKAKRGKHWDYGFEGAYQTGKNAGNLISAFAIHSKFGYTFLIKPKPRVGFEYNFASGDGDPGMGTVTLFNNILPTNHGKYGYIDYFSWRNMHDISASISAQPFPFMSTYLGYHAFFLPEPANGVFAANGAQFRAGAPGASPFAGQEIDLLLKFNPIKYFNALIGYSVFFPGQFFADTGTSDIAHFFYAQFVARY
ncbi:MAG: alginate export family protein [bacterium]|nr:alginate export family protein [bacterium]